MSDQITKLQNSDKGVQKNRSNKGIKSPLTIYFAGALFKTHDLVGNVLLGDSIYKLSDGVYRCLLPQDVELTDFRAVSIRNLDLYHVVNADLCVFNFDGTELDSGTVVEFMMAKLLDTPSVLLRTDFRSAGDQSGNEQASQWNLMCSGYPRCANVVVHAMASYQEHFRVDGSIDAKVRRVSDAVATKVLAALEVVRRKPSIYTRKEVLNAYSLALKFPGSEFEKQFSTESIRNIIDKKRSHGLL
jgi:nucleoside 2-deoxyribosyltransferase